ncbi:unnamed protein product [Withania somnifera]
MPKSAEEILACLHKSSTHGGTGEVFKKLTSEIGEPVDFELPERLSKWQQTPYTHIRRNIYLTKKVKKQLEDDGISCSCSSTAESSDACGRDCLCSILWSSCSSGCKCGNSCLNKPFHQRPVKKLKIVKTEKCGFGIVADEDIKNKEFVIEYVGEVIDDKTCEERLWKMKDSGETNFYLCEINRDMVIDASYKGNKSRYINHSCCPNTEMQRWTIDGETRIGIFATRDIKKGEHLTYDYQFVQFGADQDCHCGATECKRKLGIKPNKLNPPSSDAATLKLVASEAASTSPKEKAVLSAKHDDQTGVPPKGNSSCDSAQRKSPHNCIGQIVRITLPDESLFGAVQQFHNSTKKHLIMFEDGSREYFDLSKEDWEICEISNSDAD